jgi:transposase
MNETLKHQEAFNYYYTLKDRSLKAVAKHFGYGVRTVEKWSSEFNWQHRIHQRDKENAEKVESKTNESIVESIVEVKARYLEIIKESIDLYVQNLKLGKVKVNSIQDLERLAKLEIFLREEGVSDEDKVVNIIFKTAENKVLAMNKIYENKTLNSDGEVNEPVEYQSDDDVLDFDPERDLV